METRLLNWAAWRKGRECDPVDAHEIDDIVSILATEDRMVIDAIYVHYHEQSIFFVADKLRIPPTWVRQSIERAKDAIANE